MTAVITTLAITTTVLGLLALWLVWDRGELKATLGEAVAVAAKAKRERDEALADLRRAKRDRDDWQVNAGLTKSLYDEQVAHNQVITQGADVLAGELADLRTAARILPDLRDPDDLDGTGSGDSPIYDELTKERAA